MTSMVEVDPKLFITCRLCLEEMGQYQIVPSVQSQIKYCFDIVVESFDGLPQLICKKCEFVLSQYAATKQMYQEKQSRLKTQLQAKNEKEKVKCDETPARELNQKQPIKPVASEVQKINYKETQDDEQKDRNKGKQIRNDSVSSRNSSQDREPVSASQKSLKCVAKDKNWQTTYIKHYCCRLCSKTYLNNSSIIKHLKKHDGLFIKHKRILARKCFVGLNKFGSRSNLTNSTKNVVLDENNIIQYKDLYYYIKFISKNNKNDSSNSSDEDRVVKKKKNDYSNSSDEDFVVKQKRRKKQRLISESSNDTVVIDRNNTLGLIKSENQDGKEENNQNVNIKTRSNEFIECVDIDDSDSASVKSNTDMSEMCIDKKLTGGNDKIINNIIAVCYNKYMKRFDDDGEKKGAKPDSYIQHKVLSMGKKVISRSGTNSTGLLRYLELKNIDVVWIPKQGGHVYVRTTLKEGKNIETSNNECKHLSKILPDYEKRDFIDVFETTLNLKSSKPSVAASKDISNKKLLENKQKKKSDDVKAREEKSKKSSFQGIFESLINVNEGKSMPDIVPLYMDSDKNMSTKLLNASPVANPRQLPKKNINAIDMPATLTANEIVESNTLPGPKEDSANANTEEVLHMPIITSTMSLAPTEQKQMDDISKNSDQNGDKSAVSLPRIKVKPVSELMPNHTNGSYNNQQNSLVLPNNMLYISNALPFNNTYNQTQMIAQPSEVTNVVPSHNTCNIVQSSAPQPSSVPSRKTSVNPSNVTDDSREFIILHTVELPHTKTSSPFQYVQNLLLTHSLVLINDAVDNMPSTMVCLLQFKLLFQQECNPAVVLGLSLYCENNKFCIKVRDTNGKTIDISKLTANWQWEILKVFKGDVVDKLLHNARKIGAQVNTSTLYLVSLLKSIQYIKE